MKMCLGLARLRLPCALTTLLASSTMAAAQFSTAPTLTITKDSNAPIAALGPPSAEEMVYVPSCPASPVEITAARIKADEAAAPARRAAIRYLAGVKCRHVPAAEAALIAALRTDLNEDVRAEAAEALAECCCCTAKTMEALLIAVDGGNRDGNPAEVSRRVKSAASRALQALQHYVAFGMAVAPELDRAVCTMPPLKLPIAGSSEDVKSGPAELQLTGLTILPLPARNNLTTVTDAERRFAETAGTSASVRSHTPPTRISSVLPEIRLRPIGVIPAMDDK